MERTQELKAGTGVYMERCCPNSYGVVVRQPYDPIQHVGEDVVIDPRDKKKWAEQQIHWFIRQVSGRMEISCPVKLLTAPRGPKCLRCRRSQAPLSLKDRSWKGEDTMEDTNRNVFPPGRATAAKHETWRGEDGLRRRVSNLGQRYEAEEQALVRRSHRSQDDNY